MFCNKPWMIKLFVLLNWLSSSSYYCWDNTYLYEFRIGRIISSTLISAAAIVVVVQVAAETEVPVATAPAVVAAGVILVIVVSNVMTPFYTMKYIFCGARSIFYTGWYLIDEGVIVTSAATTSQEISCHQIICPWRLVPHLTEEPNHYLRQSGTSIFTNLGWNWVNSWGLSTSEEIDILLCFLDETDWWYASVFCFVNRLRTDKALINFWLGHVTHQLIIDRWGIWKTLLKCSSHSFTIVMPSYHLSGFCPVSSA